MKQAMMAFVAALLLAGYQPVEELAAQWEAPPLGEEIFSFNLNVGAIAPQTTFEDGSTHDTGVAVGVTAAWWPLRNLGVRANVLRAQTDGQEGGQFSAVAVYDPTVWLYGAELALRLPMVGGSFAWAPYISGGPGGKSYRWSIDNPRAGNTSFAWTIGGGLDIRSAGGSPIGFNIDVRNHRSQYFWHGQSWVDPPPIYPEHNPDIKSRTHAPDVSDFVITAGISLSL